MIRPSRSHPSSAGVFFWNELKSPEKRAKHKSQNGFISLQNFLNFVALNKKRCRINATVLINKRILHKKPKDFLKPLYKLGKIVYNNTKVKFVTEEGNNN